LLGALRCAFARFFSLWLHTYRAGDKERSQTPLPFRPPDALFCPPEEPSRRGPEIFFFIFFYVALRSTTTFFRLISLRKLYGLLGPPFFFRCRFPPRAFPRWPCPLHFLTSVLPVFFQLRAHTTEDPSGPHVYRVVSILPSPFSFRCLWSDYSSHTVVNHAPFLQHSIPPYVSPFLFFLSSVPRHSTPFFVFSTPPHPPSVSALFRDPPFFHLPYKSCCSAPDDVTAPLSCRQFRGFFPFFRPTHSPPSPFHAFFFPQTSPPLSPF